MSRLFAGTPFDIPPRCDDCGHLEPECICTAEQKARAEAERNRLESFIEPGKQTAKISVQKRKGGRKATVVEGLSAEANDLPEVLSKLQAACGAGGTVKPKEDLIEIQGDQLGKVRQTLAEIGYKVKP